MKKALSRILFISLVSACLSACLPERDWFQDSDADGFGNPQVTLKAASQPAGYVADKTDCDDSDGNIYPGNTETSDSIDNNCDTVIDALLPNHFQAVSTGSQFVCALVNDGTVQCWGNNRYAQLGDGNGGTVHSVNSPVPVTVSGIDSAVAVAAGGSHACAVLVSGRVNCWGWAASGQTGHGEVLSGSSAHYALVPVEVNGIDNAIAIGSGSFHSCALLATGQVKCWGENKTGQIGSGILTVANYTLPELVTGIDNATVIVAGYSHSCAALASGEVKCWGWNNRDQSSSAADGSHIPAPVTVPGIQDAIQIAASQFHNCALLGSGEVKCWGYNDFGQLGTGTVGVLAGSVYNPTAVLGIAGATLVSAAGASSCAGLSDGKVMCWGNNYHGQLGNGTSHQSGTSPAALLTPVQVAGVADPQSFSLSPSFGCAVLPESTIKCWGFSEDDVLPGDANWQLIPVLLTVPLPDLE